MAKQVDLAMCSANPDRPSPGPESTVRSLPPLVESGLVHPAEVDQLKRVLDRFSLAVSPTALGQIRTRSDPVGRQFLPHPSELRVLDEELDDPISDAAHSPAPGLVHRHPDRALLMPVLSCPVYCRFCFRREQVGRGGGHLDSADLDRALAYVSDHPEIREVILTGGDPLILSPSRLARILDALDQIPHLLSTRIHSRVPVVAPASIDDEMVRTLSRERPAWIVLHCNHVQEISAAARGACRRLVDAGVPMLSQSVLLRGVNDDADALTELMQTLVAMRIKPYYLHHPDLAQGTADFRLSISEGLELMAALRRRLAGPMLPTYVLDLPGGHGKVPLESRAVQPGPRPRTWLIEDSQGVVHLYPPTR